MRIVVSYNELLELGFGSAILDTTGRVWVKRQKASNMPAGWYTHGLDPRTSKAMADGKPLVVLYDAGEPMTSLRLIRRHAELCQLIDPPSVSLMPYYDFAVCWNKHHSDDQRFDL